MTPTQSLNPSTASNLLAAQLLAYTVRQLFPTAVLVQGGLHSIGFYYDFIFEQPLNTPILELIDRALRTLIKEDQPLRFRSMMRENAQIFLDKQKEPFLAFFAGESPFNIIDLIEVNQTFLPCSELPFSSTGESGVIKLLTYQPHTIAMGQEMVDVVRIVGVSQPDLKALKCFLKSYDGLLKKRDHRLLGPRQELFTFCENEGESGYIWRRRGRTLVDRLTDWLDTNKPWAEEKIVTPPFFSSPKPLDDPPPCESWLLQGHLSLFEQLTLEEKALPYRLNEQGFIFQSCPESLEWGLLGSHVNWVDQTTIFSLLNQVVPELISSLQFIEQMFRIFCFEGCWHLVSSRKKASRAGREIEGLELLKSGIAEATLHFPLSSEIEEEEGCNGSCLELRVKDEIGRSWTLSKIEIIRHDSQTQKVVDSQGKKQRGVFLSRQVLSFSRLIALLIEKNCGALPLWLADEHVRVIAIGKANHRYAESIQKRLQSSGFRSICDASEAPLAVKIHEAERCGVPFLMFIGDQERIKEGISLRAMCRKEKNQYMNLEVFVETYYRQTQSPTSTSDS
jgi:threonyl-tRNA synthetase